MTGMLTTSFLGQSWWILWWDGLMKRSEAFSTLDHHLHSSILKRNMMTLLLRSFLWMKPQSKLLPLLLKKQLPPVPLSRGWACPYCSEWDYSWYFKRGCSNQPWGGKAPYCHYWRWPFSLIFYLPLVNLLNVALFFFFVFFFCFFFFMLWPLYNCGSIHIIYFYVMPFLFSFTCILTPSWEFSSYHWDCTTHY